MARRRQPARRRPPVTRRPRRARRRSLLLTGTLVSSRHRALPLSGSLDPTSPTLWTPVVRVLTTLLRRYGPLSPADEQTVRDSVWAEARRRATLEWRGRVSREDFKKHYVPGLTGGQLAQKLTVQLHLDPPLSRLAARRLRLQDQRLSE